MVPDTGVEKGIHKCHVTFSSYPLSYLVPANTGASCLQGYVGTGLEPCLEGKLQIGP